MNIALFNNLKKPKYLLSAIGVAVLFFDLQYWMMANLPGSRDNMCVMGANLTTINVMYSIVLSLLAGIMVSSLLSLFQLKKSKLAASTAGGFSLLIGSFTVFCPLCTLPALSVFGLSIGLSFFNTYNIWIKLGSILLMLWGLWRIEKQLKGECKICVE